MQALHAIPAEKSGSLNADVQRSLRVVERPPEIKMVESFDELKIQVQEWLKDPKLHNWLREAFRKMLEKYDVNATFSGDAVLIWATTHGTAGMVRALLEAGAEVNTRDDRGNTPMMLAAWERDTEKVRVLMEFGADPLLNNSDGKTARELAKTEGMIKIIGG